MLNAMHLCFKLLGALGVVLMVYVVLVPRGTLQRMARGDQYQVRYASHSEISRHPRWASETRPS
jgi:hypothetical protein